MIWQLSLDLIDGCLTDARIFREQLIGMVGGDKGEWELRTLDK
jgi:hypothetical protein